jgi:outer membrane protein OmpA-like peptidoglycan-associated protein
MRRYSGSIMLLCTLLFGGNLYGQIWLSDRDIYDEAEEYLDAEEYIEALPLYLLLEKKEVINANVFYKIGACYLNLRGKKAKSIPYLEMAVENSSSLYENKFEETHAPLNSLLMLGIAYRVENRLDDADRIFRTLKDSIGDSDPDLQAVIDIHLDRVKNARLLGAFPGEPRTERLPDQVNNANSNYNPVLVGHDSVLYFMEQLPFYDAVMRSELGNGGWQTAENLTPAIGSDGDHIVVSASATGDQLFLYIYEPMRMGEIYTTTLSDEGWSPLEALNDHINTVYNETHASISPDGNALYFTSNRPDGFGGLDIFLSEKDENGEWGPASNLGSTINTPFNEENPVINSENEILYFSSQGHLNMGGYDVFYSLRRDNGTWRQPINMGTPVSTTDDDLFYYPLESTVSGLMSRLEEPDAYGYDIYRYNSMVFANSPRFNVRGKAGDADSTNYSEYVVNVEDDETGEVVYSTQPDPDGYYNIILPAGVFTIVTIPPAGAPVSSPIAIADDSDEFILLAAAIDSGSADTAAQQIKDTLWINPLYFSFDKAQIPAEGHKMLNEIAVVLKKYPALTVTIEGHTDAKGPQEYNLKLSEARAEKVRSYLLEKEVSDNQLTIKAMGESKPAVPNTKPDGTDNPEGRKQNRRVLIIPTGDLTNIIVFSK